MSAAYIFYSRRSNSISSRTLISVCDDKNDSVILNLIQDPGHQTIPLKGTSWVNILDPGSRTANASLARDDGKIRKP